MGIPVDCQCFVPRVVIVLCVLIWEVLYTLIMFSLFSSDVGGIKFT